MVQWIEHERVGSVVRSLFESAALSGSGRGGRNRIWKILSGIRARGEIGFCGCGKGIRGGGKFLGRPFTIRARSTTGRSGRSSDIVVIVVVEIVVIVGAHFGVFSAFVVRFLS